MWAMKALLVMTFIRLVTEMKFSVGIAPSTSKRASATKGATARRSQSREVFGLVVSVAAVVMASGSLPCLYARGQHDDFVLGHVFPRQFTDNLPRSHDKDAVADADQLRHFGGDDDNRPPLLRQPGDELV